jgi:asparagine synthase (glutamine-hydrolysing)
VLKFNKGEKKYILKEAFKDDLPDDILYRKKMGFSVPLAQWLRKEIKELTESTLFQATGGLPDYFNMGNIQNMWDQHQKGQKDNATILWSMLMFQLWWNEYMDETKQAA